jgi:hypothetical protein
MTTGIYFDERMAIKERMEEIRLDRRSLAEEYDRLKADLRVLDERDRKDQEKGFSFVAPFDVSTAITVMSEAVNILQRLVPSVSTEELQKEMTRQLATQFTETIEETVRKTERRFVSDQQEHNTYRTTKKSRVDYTAETPTVANTLKELARPVSWRTLCEVLQEEHEIKWPNRSIAMNRIMELDPRIEKIGAGKSAMFQFNQNGGL